MSEPKPQSPADPFFIGWLPLPAAYRRFLVPTAVALLLAVAATAAVVAFGQRDPGKGRWDTDEARTFDGLVFARPYAMLRVPGDPGDPPRTLLLVEDGKFGALGRVEQLLQGQADGIPVRVTGTLLNRDGRWMLELSPAEQGMRRLSGEEAAGLPDLSWPEATHEQEVSLRGEIIDPKCYLGAMRPGGGKTHKACAMLCVSGGIPPMLVTRDADGHETFSLLTTAEGGEANELVLPFVGDAVTVAGRLERRGDLLVLRVGPDGVRRR